MAAEQDYGIEELTGFAMDIIHGVGEKALTYYGKGQHQTRFDEDLVTTAELRLSEFFKTELQNRFPGHHLFKDTLESTDYSHEKKRYLWIFDPLDGVANFQAGIPIWGCSLALIENFWPIFGVFFMPATGDLFHARAGREAFWGNERIRISGIDSTNDESLLLTFSRFHNRFNTNFQGKIRSFGCTSAHICYVAMGRADAAIVANESFQDLAAARVIIESAGGRFCKIDGSDFFLNDYLGGHKIEEHLLATSAELLPQIRACLKPVP
ncbi:MAG: inositol monophosphatase family protein [Desulfobacterales bacterium]|jgi:myo-inositol-1(or 4)-monophosphatase